ncbi:MAG: hypothetical protein IPI12_14705 [Ignavibacteriales bacterium]|nr:hypothetical protein [Ignavibacteriales bacterium]
MYPIKKAAKLPNRTLILHQLILKQKDKYMFQPNPHFRIVMMKKPNVMY